MKLNFEEFAKLERAVHSLGAAQGKDAESQRQCLREYGATFIPNCVDLLRINLLGYIRKDLATLLGVLGEDVPEPNAATSDSVRVGSSKKGSEV